MNLTAGILKNLQLLPSLFFILVRVTGAFLTMPVLSHGAMPARIKIVLGLAISLLVLPSVGFVVDFNMFSPQAVLILFKELLVGIAMGFVFKIIFEVINVAGEIISMQSGLSFASMADPTNPSNHSPLVANFYIVFATLLFLISNGHLAILYALIMTFKIFPIYKLSISLLAFKNLVSFASVLFAGSILLSLPIITVLFITNLIFAFIGASAPQLNIINIGTPVIVLVAFLMITLTAPAVFLNIQGLFKDGFNVLGTLFT